MPEPLQRHHDDDAVPAPDFLGRVVRLLALFCTAYGVLTSVNVVLFWIGQGLPHWAFGSSAIRFRSAELALRIAMVLSGPLLLTGGIFLLRWKPIGRTLLIFWSACEILTQLTSTAVYLASFTATVRPNSSQYPPIWFIDWTIISGAIASVFPPAAILVLLLQRDVANLWPEQSGGFDVVPMATEPPAR